MMIGKNVQKLGAKFVNLKRIMIAYIFMFFVILVNVIIKFVFVFFFCLFVNLNFYFFQLGNIKEAIHECTEILTHVDENNHDALLDRGEAYMIDEQYDKGLFKNKKI